MKRLHIGMFDSGVGGLTVLKELIQQLPCEAYTYFGDTARFPYGSKSASTVIRYSLENSIFLIEQGVQLLVVACSTATALSLERLKSTFNIPVMGVIAPAIEKVVETTQSKRIGIIATRGTVMSGIYQKEIAAHLSGARIHAAACPLLVSLIEERVTHPHIIRMIIKESLAPLRKKNIDTLVLGCTHYPLVESYIREEIGPDVSIINPGKACAEQLQRALKEKSLQARSSPEPQYRFFVSDDPKRFQATGETFLGFAMKNVRKV
jgi:glutamate racemase